MKGKKTDPNFLSEFITECVQKGINSTDEIVKHAKQNIMNIDEDIKRVERSKIVRSKLLDVIATFEKPIKNNKEEIKYLSFFKIQNPQVCKFVCDSLRNNVISVEEISNLSKTQQYSLTDVLFCIKQLIEYKIVSRSGSHLLRGEMFDQYLKFVLRDE